MSNGTIQASPNLSGWRPVGVRRLVNPANARQHALFAGPLCCRNIKTGAFVRLADVQRVGYIPATGAFRVSNQGEWGELTPTANCADAIKSALRNVVTATHFGSVFNAEDLHLAIVTYTLRCSHGSRIVEDGIQFSESIAVGERIGIILTDLIARGLPGAVTIEGDTVTLDLSRMPVDPVTKELNLDPITASAQSGYLLAYLLYSYGWAATKAGGGMQVLAGGDVQCKTAAGPDSKYCAWHIARGMLDFATGEETPGSTATLTLTCKAFQATTHGSLTIRQIAAYAPLDGGDWTMAGDAVVSDVDMSGYNADDPWGPLDVTDQLQTATNTCFVVLEKHDVDDDPPPGLDSWYGTTFYGPDAEVEADRPVLIVTAPAGGYNLYAGTDGQGRGSIDWTTPVATAWPGDTDITVAQADDTDVWYGLTAESAAEVESTVVRTLRVTVSSGVAVGDAPNRPVYFRVRPGDDATIDYDFLYLAAGAAGVATAIQVATCTGPGGVGANWGGAESISISSARAVMRKGTLAASYSDGQTVYLAVRAVTAAGAPSPVLVPDGSPVACDSTGPVAVTYVTGGQDA